MAGEWSFEIDGLGELAADLEKTQRAAPDLMLKYIRKAGNRFRTEVRRETRRLTRKHTGKLLKGYQNKVVLQRGSLRMFEAQISGRAPHFHLVEHGHVGKTPDRSGVIHTFGRVAGRHMMETTVKEWENGAKLIPFAQKAVDEAIREGLIR